MALLAGARLVTSGFSLLPARPTRDNARLMPSGRGIINDLAVIDANSGEMISWRSRRDVCAELIRRITAGKPSY